MAIFGHIAYGTIVKYDGRFYQVIDTLYEKGNRKVVLEFAEDEQKRGELDRMTVAQASDLDMVTDTQVIAAARLRQRNAARN